MAKLYRRWRPNGDEFYVNESGQVCKPGHFDEIAESDPNNRIGFTIHESLRDFNDLATGTGVITEADQKLVEAWESIGLSPEAARIAANIHEAAAPFKDDTEFWAAFKWGR